MEQINKLDSIHYRNISVCFALFLVARHMYASESGNNIRMVLASYSKRFSMMFQSFLFITLCLVHITNVIVVSIYH